MLPTDATERKAIPIFSGVIAYFPDALAEVAKLSKEGNDQHNPGKPLHWDRSKSGDELDALTRHLVGMSQSASIAEEITEARAVAWRALAHLQKAIERRDRAEIAAPTNGISNRDLLPNVHEQMRAWRRQDD